MDVAHGRDGVPVRLIAQHSQGKIGEALSCYLEGYNWRRHMWYSALHLWLRTRHVRVTLPTGARRRGATSCTACHGLLRF